MRVRKCPRNRASFSFAYAVIAILFYGAISHGVVCPIRVGTQVPWFLIVFGVVTMSRDWFDFAWAWAFLYPVQTPAYRWPITWIMGRPWRFLNADGYVVLGVLFMIVGFTYAYLDGWWNYGYWARARVP